MKRILKRNQVVLTLLAVMIAVAGYLNYTADSTADDVQEVSGGGNTGSQELLEISDEDLLRENLAVSSTSQIVNEASDEAGENSQANGSQEMLSAGTEPESKDSSPTGAESVESGADVIDDTPGTAILTNAGDILDYVASVQLSREQTRARNKETLLAIIDNENVEEAQKQNAINSMVRLTETAEKETAAEALLAAKGYDNSIVYISEDSVDVVINRETLSDAEKAQVEDIVKRKTEYTVDKIVITLLDLG